MVHRRDFLKSTTAGMAAGSAQGSRPPNILYLHSHDTGRWIEPYGQNVPAPNYQKLASEGVMFRHAFDAAPTCSPSRASLLTGHCPHNNGMFGLAHRGFVLNDYKEHVLYTLRKRGYRSALFGVQHIAKTASMIGYDEIGQTANNKVASVAPAAANFLKNAPKEPFFLDVGFFETHREFAAPGPREDARFCQPPVTVPDTLATRQDIAAFKASARILDEGVGTVLTALESSGLAANTLVILTTDHGIAFPDMKCNLTNHGTGVLLILRGPGGFSGGKASDALVSHLDLYPTICDLTGAEPPSWLQGRSLLPLIRGEKDQINEQVCAEVNYHAAYEPKRSVRTMRYNYIRRFGGRSRPVLPNCDDGLSKSVWLKSGWQERPVPAEALYDLTFDPQERYNCASDPAMRTVLEEMRGRMDRWMTATKDPILQGPIKAPPGAVANDPDGISPTDKPLPVSG